MSSLSSVGGSSSTNTLSPPPASTSSGASTSTTSTSGLTGLSDDGVAITGLISGLNTNEIVQAMLAPQQQEITNLQNQQASVVQLESTYNTMQADLTALQSDVNSLSSATGSVFDGRTATSSNTNLVTASASSDAQPGVYSFTVNSLAQAQEIASQGFNSANSSITQGTFQFQVGSGAVNTITVNGTNDTLQGLANAINNANAGVTASIVNDGSSSQGYHLLLTADNTGTSNAITITNNLAAGSGDAMQPEFNSTYIGSAVTGSNWSGTSTPTSNSGSGAYTGAANDTYTFTVTNGGTVGTDNGITLSYTDSSGANTGTITLNAGDAGALQNVAQGLQVQFNAGTLVTGNTFTITGFNPNVQSAANASISLGSGSGAMTVTSPTNTIDNVFNGITLNLAGADPSQPVSVTVANNTQAETTAITNFVNDYNTVISYINQNDSYNTQTEQGGILLGNTQATNIFNQLSESVTNVVSGVNPLANNLSAIGISVNSDGTLSINNTTLTQALSGQLPGVSASDVANLFGQNGQSTNNDVQYVYSPSTMKAMDTPIQVQITQAATQGSMTATNALAASTTITSGSNDTFSVSVNGNTSTPITLPPGTYTPQQLAQQVQSAIDGSSQLNNQQVDASVNSNGQLVLTSQSYGSNSTVAIGSGDALATLGFTGSESGTGQNVAGSFLVNGVSEPATGSGQTLTGDSTNTNTAGLVVLSTLTPAQVSSTPEASVTVTQGIGSQLSNLLNQMLDPTNGQLTTYEQSLQSQASGIGTTITQLQQSMQLQQTELLQEFAQMETNLAAIQSTSEVLNSALAGISPPPSSSSSSNNSGSSSTSL
ncbi:MAG TPA: flagellar filament capping protein FliD [Gemmataceae bacterium]|nr:flagellar filament capping protein FliD [Gemmataceae bacterium]